MGSLGKDEATSTSGYRYPVSENRLPWPTYISIGGWGGTSRPSADLAVSGLLDAFPIADPGRAMV